jgi:hypothetical protein
MGRVSAKYRQRLASVFKRCDHDMTMALNAMLAERAASGQLESGATIRGALRIFEEYCRRGLDQVMAETAKLIEHRGRKWQAAFIGIGEELSAHVSTARSQLANAFRAANPEESPSATQVIDTELTALRLRLENHMADYCDGWTAPVPKLWKDRHPTTYAVGLLLIGALVGLAVGSAKDHFLKTPQPPTTHPSR